MDYIIKSIGIIIAVAGVVFATMPMLAIKFVDWAKVGKRVYIGGVIRLVFGGLLIWASPVASIMWIPLVWGILMVIAGVLIFVISIEKTHGMLAWWEAQSESARRAWAIIAAVVGVLLIYSA